MAVIVEELLNSVLNEVKNSNEITIISGYASPDIIEKIADYGKKVDFYYGMFPMDGITTLTYKKLLELNNKYDNLHIYIVYDYHVHSKCYIFKKEKNINILVGSANCSKNGLSSGRNSEMLVELNSNELKDNDYIQKIFKYSEEIKNASVSCVDPLIVPKSKTKKKKTNANNPFIAIMPLYTLNSKKRKVVQKAHGLNWGLANNKHKKGDTYAEANIPIRGVHIDCNPIMFPYFPERRTTQTGKITRRYDPITVLWDDGVIMEMIFSGNGVERPTRGTRKEGEPFKCYPKQLTSADGGGAILGEYLRKRMNIDKRKQIKYSDLKKYKKDYIELRYISPGYYEADFSGTPIKTKK